MKLLLAMLGVSAMVGFAAPAYGDGDPPPAPDGDDAGFLAALHQAGISYTNPAQVITSGRAVCTCLTNGESGLELVQGLNAKAALRLLDCRGLRRLGRSIGSGC